MAGDLASAPIRRNRRTQRERREATIDKLLQATIDTVAEVGYARTTTKLVCQRAGISQGGLFRHFPSREDLVVAAAEEVAARQMANARERLAKVSVASRDGVVAALRVLRDAARSPMNVVFHELVVAARTDDGLAERFRPSMAAYYLQIYKVAAELFGIESDPNRRFEVAVFGLLAVFDAETVGRRFYPDPDVEEQRLQWVADMVEETLGPLR